ncbi:MAG: aldehyde dehydrogenase family protein [Coxiellaceae bacterium]|nr:aldehyde dehydrogenase family protein [Coxiellaceae bacterium]
MQWNVISPVDNSVYASGKYATVQQIESTLADAKQVHHHWKKVDIAERARLCRQFVDNLFTQEAQICEELSWQMGRPISQCPGELNGVKERAHYMIDIAEQSLADIIIEDTADQKRFIRREPVGTVMVIAPWNYPYLTAINSIIPAIMAGNCVILKHASQTPLVAERLFEAFQLAGLPQGVFQYLQLDRNQAEQVITNPRIDFVAFTGSVAGGRSIYQQVSQRFIGCGLELGGKDCAFVTANADIAFTLDSLVDGSYFNSGQSCCGIERIYVSHKIFNDFVEGFVERVYQYRLGNPLDTNTTLGPMVRDSSANAVRQQIADAVQQGATALIDANRFDTHSESSAYLAPQALINVDHTMALMREENFGPVVGIMAVNSEQQAIDLMNDSPYGLTASIWSNDIAHAEMIGNQIQTGTWFMNRCDYLDPALAWTGVKDTGMGVSLSELGYNQLTHAKSFYLRTTNG